MRGLLRSALRINTSKGMIEAELEGEVEPQLSCNRGPSSFHRKLWIEDVPLELLCVEVRRSGLSTGFHPHPTVGGCSQGEGMTLGKVEIPSERFNYG